VNLNIFFYALRSKEKIFLSFSKAKKKQLVICEENIEMDDDGLVEDVPDNNMQTSSNQASSFNFISISKLLFFRFQSSLFTAHLKMKKFPYRL
jgi:hypothetical protein